MIGEQPFMQGNLAALEHRSNRDAVLLAAIVALDHAVADRAFGVSFGRTTTLGWEPLRTERATMRADRTIGPTQSFKMLAGLILVRSEAHTSELQSLMRTSYAVFCLKQHNYHLRHIYHNI